jgi:NTP pyrophosphatase (non-canonical NTP hydrolase)
MEKIYHFKLKTHTMRKSLQLKVFNQAIDKFGRNNQMDMAVEECAELIKAINKYKRKPSGYTADDILDEIADVEIMCQQLRIMFDNRHTRVDDIKKKKIIRLQSRIESHG